MANTTRERLIQTAADLFYECGFQAVGLDQVLDRVGISKTAFYKHFESKNDLIVAVLERRDGEDIAAMHAFMAERGGADPRERLLAMFTQMDEWFRDPGFKGCLFMNAATEFPNPNDPINRAAVAHGAHMAAVVRGLLVQGQLPNPDALTRQIMLLVAGAISSRHVGGDVEAGRAAREAAGALVGVGA